jgi:hypothetical protein
MKKTLTLTLLLAFNITMNAQNADKLKLAIGHKINSNSIDSVANQQKRGEESMDMKTISNSFNEYEIIEITQEGYKLKSTLQKININFDGFGQKIVYNSEDPSTHTGMMAEQLKGKIGVADTIEISLEGKLKEDETDKSKGKGKGRGMMRMMDQQSNNIENAFLFVPAEAKEGSGWKKDQEKDGVKSQTIYFVDKINLDIAEISFKKKTKGSKVIKSQQGEMNMDIDNLSTGAITVNLKTGLVKSYAEDLTTSTKMNMMGQDMPSSGKTISRIEFK